MTLATSVMNVKCHTATRALLYVRLDVHSVLLSPRRLQFCSLVRRAAVSQQAQEFKHTFAKLSICFTNLDPLRSTQLHLNTTSPAKHWRSSRRRRKRFSRAERANVVTTEPHNPAVSRACCVLLLGSRVHAVGPSHRAASSLVAVNP
jgi:hypothetical protein